MRIKTLKWLKEDPFLKVMFKQAQSFPPKIYLVGGYLRNKLLSRESKDLDLLIDGEVSSFGKNLSRELKGSFFYLDKTRGIARVTTKNKVGFSRTIDLISLRESLENNLKARDFTIDALALDLNLLYRENLNLPPDLFDVSSGLADLKVRKIRAISPKIFQADPLRILRAIRLATDLGFEIEENTKNLIQKESFLLGKVAPERIHEELFSILSLPKALLGIKLADSLGVVEVLFPELNALKGVTQDRYHHLDVWGHTLLTLEELEKIISQQLEAYFPGFERKIKTHLKRVVQGRSRLSLLKLGALFHDLGKPQTKTEEEGRVRFLNHPEIGADLAQKILKDFKVGKKGGQIVSRLIKEHLRPGFLAPEEVTPQAINRFLRDSGSETIEVILLSLADRLASRGPASTPEKLKKHLSLLKLLVKTYFEKEVPKPPPLITGKDLLKNFPLKPGPLIGELLGRLEDAKFEGKITNKKEALRLAEAILKKKSAGGS